MAPTMVQDSSKYPYPADHPPSYAQAMEGVQLSTRHLSQAMVDQHCNSRQNTSAGADNDQDEDVVKEKKKKIIKYGCLIVILILLILIVIG